MPVYGPWLQRDDYTFALNMGHYLVAMGQADSDIHDVPWYDGAVWQSTAVSARDNIQLTDDYYPFIYEGHCDFFAEVDAFKRQFHARVQVTFNAVTAFDLQANEQAPVPDLPPDAIGIIWEEDYATVISGELHWTGYTSSYDTQTQDLAYSAEVRLYIANSPTSRVDWSDDETLVTNWDYGVIEHTDPVIAYAPVPPNQGPPGGPVPDPPSGTQDVSDYFTGPPHAGQFAVYTSLHLPDIGVPEPSNEIDDIKVQIGASFDLLMVYGFRPPRHKFVYPDGYELPDVETRRPHVRVFPRDDLYGPSRRTFPNPTAAQQPGRITGYL